MIVEGFAGPGGWDVALRRRQTPAIGLELDPWACATRAAENHPTIRCDVTAYPTAPFRGRITGKVDSPVCVPFSQGGNGDGLEDMALVHQTTEDLAHGRDTRALALTSCKDPRSLLAAEPMRWHHDLRPEWIAMEQVPAVLPLWQQYARILTGWGYSTWCGVLNAADYGPLGQSRRRAILIASRTRQVRRPEATHYDPRKGDQLWGQPWTTMAEALGWGYTDRPAPTITGGGTYTGGAEPWSSTSRAAMRAAMEDRTHWAWRRPAPTVTGTVGHVGGKQAEGHLNLSPAEAARLQGFPDGYRFQGNKGQVALQIGNAVPPLLAEAVLNEAVGPAIERMEVAA
ncbi:DNA cytosine methyltransferase [Streptomyces sp. NPDC058848]|uniref:DNA cytosine methyltransferase n=1 Tax=unclassified Streptomyces TaxID=2593676 RepID=UPI003697ACE7